MILFSFSPLSLLLLLLFPPDCTWLHGACGGERLLSRHSYIFHSIVWLHCVFVKLATCETCDHTMSLFDMAWWQMISCCLVVIRFRKQVVARCLALPPCLVDTGQKDSDTCNLPTAVLLPPFMRLRPIIWHLLPRTQLQSKDATIRQAMQLEWNLKRRFGAKTMGRVDAFICGAS